MYKLSVCIYLNHVPFDARQKSYEFKSLVNFGTSQKNSKSPEVGRFSENHAKSKSPSGVSYNFPKIYAKTRFSELHERASKASSTQTKQTKYSLHGRSEHRERARQAQSSQIKQTKHRASPAWRSLREQSAV